jgi:hypothetical protein
MPAEWKEGLLCPIFKGDKLQYNKYYYAGAWRRGQSRDTHLRIYRGILATRGGREHFMYAPTAETPRSGQARHAHLSSYRGNLKNVYACIYVILSY